MQEGLDPCNIQILQTAGAVHGLAALWRIAVVSDHLSKEVELEYIIDPVELGLVIRSGNSAVTGFAGLAV